MILMFLGGYIFLKSLSISLIMASSLYGAGVLPDNLKSESIGTPLGGENTSDPSFRINSKFSPYMRNVFIDNGKIEGIKGYTVLGTTRTLQKVTGIFPFYLEDGTKYFLVTDSSVTLQTQDFNTYVLVSSASNSGVILNWMQVRNKMWGFNGSDSIITWDGTTKQTLNGLNNLPNVPKFKFGAYWQDRVWGFNTTAGASNLDFSSVVSTDATIINPDDHRAWPATNEVKIGQGDGELGTSLWVKNGQLKCGKERSKYTIYGTNVSNYFARKDDSNGIGVVSNDSVVNMDDATYYLSDGGIYKDDERISDLIEPDIDEISKGRIATVTNLWDTQPEFSNGQFFGSTATATGFLTNQSKTFRINTAETEPVGQFVQFVTTGYSDTGYANLHPGTNLPGTARVVPGNVEIWARVNDVALCVGGNALTMNIRNNANPNNADNTTQDSNTYPKSVSSLTTTFSKLSFVDLRPSPYFGDIPNFDFDQINISSFAIKLTNIGLPSGCVFDFYPATNTNFSNVDVFASSVTQFISEVTTLPMVTAWSNFEAAYNTNGGNIRFAIRTSTSSVNITTQPWSSIVPGSVIAAQIINNYVQWAATLTSQISGGSADPSSNIDNVRILHIEGSSSFNRAFGINWKNRYWLATSTDGGNISSLFYVKSKITNEFPNAWMPVEGINVRCFAKDGDVFYGGSSSTGTVYRLDTGTNFNGSTIPYVYHTPDMPLGNIYTSKKIYKYLIDADKNSESVMSVDSSIDGASFSTKTVSLDGSGHAIRVINGVTNPAKTLRVRLSQYQLDQLFGINDFTILYTPTEILEGGN